MQATATLTINSVPAFPTTQSMTGLTIGGVDVIGGATITTDAASTTSTVAQAVCLAIQSQTGSTGYGCAANGANVVIQAALVGTAANGLQVVASGPPDAAAANSEGAIRVLDATTGYSIDSIAINRGGAGGTVQLITDPVVATGNCGGATGIDCGNQAQLICQAINSGPNLGVYIARSGNPGAPPAWGTCESTVDAFVGIKRNPADTWTTPRRSW
ncbi:MAG: hypothetical protein IPK39_16550 [Sulfuritalea sp.]|nr:hypothetical protein [Sulfuritalea sp.]